MTYRKRLKMRIKNFDIFKKRLNFTYKGKDGVSTILGGSLGLLIYFMLLFYLIDLMMDYISRRNSV